MGAQCTSCGHCGPCAELYPDLPRQIDLDLQEEYDQDESCLLVAQPVLPPVMAQSEELPRLGLGKGTELPAGAKAPLKLGAEGIECHPLRHDNIFTKEAAPEVPPLREENLGTTEPGTEATATPEVPPLRDENLGTTEPETEATATPEAHPLREENLGTTEPETEATPEASKPLFFEAVFDAGREDVIVHISKRPLGAEFSKRSDGPTKISKVRPQSHASELGLQVGWAIKSIGGDDMRSKTLQETQETLKKHLEGLLKDTPRTPR